MDSDYTVKVEYYNKQTGQKEQRVYPFTGYINNMAFELKQVFYEIENLFYKIEGYKERDNWSEESKNAFAKIRKKMLDNINNIARLHSTLCYKGIPCGSMPAGEMMAKLIDHA